MTTYSVTLTESGNATASLSDHWKFEIDLNETGSATDMVAPVQRLPSLDISNQNYPVLSLNVPTTTQGLRQWLVQAGTHINSVRGGAHNTTTSVTLNANSATTTITDSRIGAQSHISLSPITQSAAAEQWWIASQTNGSATIGHTDSPDATRTFRVNIVA